jgi:DNA-binding IclR family transcriptional regulator
MSTLVGLETADVSGRERAGPTSIAKALALVSAIADRHDTVRLSDLAEAVALPRPTTHRLLKALEASGFVGRVVSHYQLGNRFFELGEAARWSAYGELRERAQSPLAALFEQGGSAVHLAVLEGTDVLYLEKITGSAGSRIPTRVGSRMPATCTALGKAMLAFSPPEVLRAALCMPMARVTAYSLVDPRRLMDELKLVRSSGVAYEREEGRLGVSCVASPVLVERRVVGAVSVCIAGGIGPSDVQAGHVRTAAAQIAASLAPVMVARARLDRACG